MVCVGKCESETRVIRVELAGEGEGEGLVVGFWIMEVGFGSDELSENAQSIAV